MKNLLLYLLVIALPLATSAQNLIPDPGFEDWDGTIGENPNTLGGLTHWYNANGTPESSS